MTRILLINDAEPEETRAALLEDGRLEELRCERSSAVKLVGNIYKGRVVNIETSIEAAFIDIGVGRNAFLHVSDCVGAHGTEERARIQDHLKLGEEMLIQVTRESIGSKGPVLTCNVSVPGRFLVLLPFSDAGGVSRRIEEDEDRTKLRTLVRELEKRAGAGLIVRTAGVDRTKKELLRDLKTLDRIWESVRQQARSTRAPALIYEDSDLVVRALRDMVDRGVTEIHVDTPEAQARAEKALGAIHPETAGRLRLHPPPVPLFHAFGLEEIVDRLRSRTVPLPGGGSIVFDATEALVAVDVNSGRMRNGECLEETALQTNLEAAVEIARQLRLRDLGGVVAVDFIDMREVEHNRVVERTFRENLRRDRARVRTSRIGAFGVYVLTRRRAGAGQISERRACPRCSGTGEVISSAEISLRVFRELMASAARPGGGALRARVAAELAADLRERRSGEIEALAAASGRELTVEIDPSLPEGAWVVEAAPTP